MKVLAEELILFAIAVCSIAYDGVKNVFHVPSELVSPASEWLEFQQCITC